MKPFIDRGQFSTIERQFVTASRFVPDKNGYGVEIRRGRDLFRRTNNFFISSGRWTEMRDDGIIDQEVPPLVLGQQIDILDFSPYLDVNEKKSAPDVLETGFIISAKTLDYEGETCKDGRITVFNLSARGYVEKEEVPYQSRGIKATNDTISGYSVGKSKNPFEDGGASDLGLPKVGFYGMIPDVSLVFVEKNEENGLGIKIDDGEFRKDFETGAHGMALYSSEFGTDSIAFAGLKK